MIVLAVMTSCVMQKNDPHLMGHIYLNETTQDRIEFTGKDRVTITWASDQGTWNEQTFSGFRKNTPYEFFYSINDGDTQMYIIMASIQVTRFPYDYIFEVSDSRDCITVTRNNGDKEIFKKK
jgi:hypothetical protein